MHKHNDVIVLRTSFGYEVDMAADALKEAGIPFFRRQETAAGLEFGMPVATAPVPGLRWIVLVPDKAADDAREIIASLPLSQEPEDVLERSTQPRNRVLRALAFCMLLWILIGLGYDGVKAVLAWFGYPS